MRTTSLNREVRTPAVLLAVAVGVVLADSSVVTIALPDILARYHVEISTLAWVLTAFNLALALSALPAAFLARRRPVPVFGVGILVAGIGSSSPALWTCLAIILIAIGLVSAFGDC